MKTQSKNDTISLNENNEVYEQGMKRIKSFFIKIPAERIPFFLNACEYLAECFIVDILDGNKKK